MMAMLAFSLGMNAQVEPAYSLVNRDTISTIFIYSPGPDKGLHMAYQGDDDKWHDLGQILASDYGPWGSAKKMYTPYVTQAKDGSWRALWSVNDYAPTFAVAYSEDLFTWRPQDYPIIREKGVSEPIAYEMDDGSWDVYVKTKQGKRYLSASADFRHFQEDSIPAEVDEVLWEKNKEIVNGKSYVGNSFEVPILYIRYAMAWANGLKKDREALAATRKTLENKNIAPLKATLTIDNNRKKRINSNQTGIFFEDISYAADGGIWAELLQNGDFEYDGEDHKHTWDATTAWTGAHISDSDPLSLNNKHYTVLTAGGTLENEGWEGIMDKGEVYAFSVYAKNIDQKKNQMQVSIVTADGIELASEKIKIEGNSWRKYILPISTVDKKRTDIKKCKLRITLKKVGKVGLDMVSLMPAETFHGHGFRKDLADSIAALKPKFVRFPGGCATHGDGLGNIYNWKETVGAKQDRKPAKNIWGYHQSRRLGFYEYFLLCEDLGADALPVLAAGVPCQNSQDNAMSIAGQQGGIPFAKDAPNAEVTMEAYIQDMLDLIDYANGDPKTSKWAKMRADAGHEAPFNLKMIGIGNEDLISTTFEERYLAICKAIHQRYPDIKIVGTVGPFHNPSSDYTEGWKFTKEHKNLFYAVDEHYYEQPEWFIENQDYYDDYDRSLPKVYLGEYAARSKDAKLNAAAEGLYLINMERNGDVVDMTSYAPLLSKNGHSNWSPDMIYFDNEKVITTPNYQVQKLFSTHEGDTYISSTLKLDDSQKQYQKYIGASVVKNSKTGQTWLKIANTLSTPLTVSMEGKTFKIEGKEVKVFGL